MPNRAGAFWHVLRVTKSRSGTTMPIPACPCLSMPIHAHPCPSGSTRPQREVGRRESQHPGEEHGYQTSPRGTAQRGTGLPPCAGYGPGDKAGRRIQSRFKEPESLFPLEHPSGFLLQHRNSLGSLPCHAVPCRAMPCHAMWVPRLGGWLEASPKIDGLKQSL